MRLPRRLTTVSLAAAAALLGVAARPPGPTQQPPGRATITLAGEVTAGESWSHDLAGDLRVVLAPRPLGWEIVVVERGRDENLARLTPPLHAVPNPREVEGWHFRNADNSGPNEAGEKNVNAPGEVREFIFSPTVGRTIDGAGAGRAPTSQEIEEVRRWGRGALTILEYRLADLGPGKTARFAWMRFSITLSWPRTRR